MSEPTDEDAAAHDVDQVELVDFRRPVRREMIDRPTHYRDRPAHLSVVEIRLASVHLGCDSGESFARRVSGLVIGENPGKYTHPDLPLFPWPASSSAGRLLAMSEMTGGQYLGGLYRRNLVDARAWSRPHASRRARSIVTSLFDMPKELRVVLCGLKVMRAFDQRVEFWESFRLESRQMCVVIPHPSRLNHVYNDETARLKTRGWVRWAALGEQRPNE